MGKSFALKAALERGGYDRALSALYAPEGDEAAVAGARSRALQAAEAFERQFGPAENGVLLSSPGRTELGGNHTDHQRGHVLCGSVNLDMLACAAPNGRREVRLLSQGYPAPAVSLENLSPLESERGGTAALIRGMAAGAAALGCPVRGFDLYVTSEVPAGSGLSSSAAFEVLLGNVLRELWGAPLDPISIAKLGQRAENDYFGKPCGLMDQMGVSVGGAVSIDFLDPAEPVVRKVGYDFSRSGHALCIVDTRSQHADLTGDYADIPREMGAVAAYFGKQVLRQVPEADFRGAIPALRKRCGDRAVLRAMHFYDDDRYAQAEADALAAGDFDGFLELVNRSGLSSALLLQNIWSPASPANQAVSLALAVGRELLDGAGAIRVHGGGFAGTIQAFVPAERLDAFRQGMEALLGPGACHILRIRPQGGCVLLPEGGIA